jgi:hypothetical protein
VVLRLSANQYLGIGVYTAQEAAMYVRAHPRAIQRWVYGGSGGKPVIDSQLDSRSDDRPITFTDMIQCLAVRTIRLSYPRISLPKIRDAVETATKEYGLASPLARRHKLCVYANSTIVIRIDDDSIHGLTGRDKHQAMMVPIVEPFLDEITYNLDGLASRWVPNRFNDYQIVLDPMKRFGQPILMPYGILVSAIHNSVMAEGSPLPSCMRLKLKLRSWHGNIGINFRCLRPREITCRRMYSAQSVFSFQSAIATSKTKYSRRVLGGLSVSFKCFR